MTDKAKLEEIKKLANAMYYAAMYLTTDASQLHKAMDEYHKFIIHECKEEPVSDDLGEYINELSKQFPEVSFAKLSRIAVRVVKWQKEQFEKNRLKHCNSITNEQAELESDFIDQHLDKYQRMPTFLDAIEYGMRLQKEQMMKDVMPCVLEWYDGFVLNFTEEQLNDVVTKNNINIGDKVKLIVIKED